MPTTAKSPQRSTMNTCAGRHHLLFWLALVACSAGAVQSTKLYIYPLDKNLTDCKPGWSTHSYGAELAIPQALNKTSQVVTDPSTADLFLVPAALYCLTQGTVIKLADFDKHRGAYHQVAWKVLEIIREQPFYDRYQGRDHIFTFTFDNGFCGFAAAEGSPEVLQHSIILSHWGMTVPESKCSVHDWIHSYERCQHPLKYPLAPGALPCFVPDKDVVVPPALYDDIIQHFPAPLQQFQDDFLMFNRATPNNKSGPVPRNESWPALPAMKRTLLQFVGETRHDTPSYSHGVRQAISQLNNTPGFEVQHTSYAQALSAEESRAHAHASLFCLAATGSGFGVRLKQAAISGCIPVLIDDHVRFEFEEVLPYSEFAIRVPQHMIYLLPEILEELVKDEAQKLEVMVRRQACVATLLSWAPNGIGKAAEVLLCALSGRGLHRKHTQAVVNWETCQVTCEVGHSQLP